MSAGYHGPSVAEKIDLRKYLLVLRRRMWWGIIPFCLLAVTFGVIAYAVPPKYASACVIRASKSEVARIIGGTTKMRTSTAELREEMLRYDRVMEALVDSEVMARIKREARNDPELLARREDELYQRIVKNTHISSMGRMLIRVVYFGETPTEARDVLDKLTTHYIDKVLGRQQNDARRARSLAFRELKNASDELESLETRIAQFLEEHPAVSRAAEGGKRSELRALQRELENLDQEINARRRILDRYNEQLQNMPEKVVDLVTLKPNPQVAVLENRLAELRTQLGMLRRRVTPLHPDFKNLQKQIQGTEEELALAKQQRGEDQIQLRVNEKRERLEERKLELEAYLDGLLERRRNKTIQKTKLEEDVHALPGLQKELAKLRRQRDAAAKRHEDALKRFKRVDEDFKLKMEGLVAFEIVAPARRPYRPNNRHRIRLGLMGLFLALVAGVGAIAGTEFFDQSFTEVEAARDFLRVPSLGVIPAIETPGDRRSRRIRTLVILAALVLLVAAVVLAMQVRPVADAADWLWQKIRAACKDLA